MLDAGSDLLVGAAVLLHGIEIGPSASSARSAAAAELSASLTSSGTAVTVPPAPAGFFVSSSSRSSSMSASATSARVVTSARLAPRPIPDAAPVTNARSPAGPFLLLRSLV
ncbi:hypothetical protein ACVILE_000138 [Streptomyces sp. M18.1]